MGGSSAIPTIVSTIAIAATNKLSDRKSRLPAIGGAVRPDDIASVPKQTNAFKQSASVSSSAFLHDCWIHHEARREEVVEEAVLIDT